MHKSRQQQSGDCFSTSRTSRAALCAAEAGAALPGKSGASLLQCPNSRHPNIANRLCIHHMRDVILIIRQKTSLYSWEIRWAVTACSAGSCHRTCLSIPRTCSTSSLAIKACVCFGVKSSGAPLISRRSHSLQEIPEQTVRISTGGSGAAAVPAT